MKSNCGLLYFILVLLFSKYSIPQIWANGRLSAPIVKSTRREKSSSIKLTTHPGRTLAQCVLHHQEEALRGPQSLSSQKIQESSSRHDQENAILVCNISSSSPISYFQHIQNPRLSTI